MWNAGRWIDAFASTVFRIRAGTNAAPSFTASTEVKAFVRAIVTYEARSSVPVPDNATSDRPPFGADANLLSVPDDPTTKLASCIVPPDIRSVPRPPCDRIESLVPERAPPFW